MQSISAQQLETVIGGLTSSKGSSVDANDQLLTTLQSIQSSIKDLGNNNNNQGLFGGNNGLLFMTMALAMQRQNQVVVYGGGRCGGWGGGWSYRSW